MPRRAAFSCAFVAAAFLVTACAPAGQLPEGIRLNVYLTRSDVPARKLEIQVSNGSQADVTVTAVTPREAAGSAPARCS